MLIRLRVSLPDRPGALGQVARVLGTLGVDIHQVTVLDRETGRAVDDFTVSWPGSPEVEEVRDRLAAVPGVTVEGAWPTREAPGFAPDYDLLKHVMTDPARAFPTLVDAAPHLVGADWAATIAFPPEAPGAKAVHRSWNAPEIVETAEPLPSRPAVYGGAAPLMSVPLLDAGLCLIVVRTAGLAFHRAELDKMARLTEIIAMMARTADVRARAGDDGLR